jgi:hypothetical protein
MFFIRGSWLKVILWPYWPFALVYWLSARRRGEVVDWATFDFWAVRAFWAAVLCAVLVGVVSGIVQGH